MSFRLESGVGWTSPVRPNERRTLDFWFLGFLHLQMMIEPWYWPLKHSNQIGDIGWRDMSSQLASLLKFFNLQYKDLTFFKSGLSRAATPSGVPLLKREAVSAFAKSRGLLLRQMTKSYFETPSGDVRVVCTFSSRYEGKGKRKYWFGYSKIWDRWLEGSSESFLLLGCKDSRLCFALPLDFIRAQLPNLWSTGTGKSRYWHLDIVDRDEDKNLLYVPRLKKAVALSGFAFTF